ncbi:uncharacterized protein C8orf76 homolog isoform X2 [Narcine bancroftii]|uniref:uncharacterized protein C8orf76 homolog isoform X2 n=1 Tax=Narcine bancroftii TaxID=1343680 RepID=UPI003831D5E7
MVDVGSQFDDSFFDEFRQRKWFWGNISAADDVEKLTALKFRGDLAFKRQDYQTALCEYTCSLALVPDTNITLRRDLQEARARCLSCLGREEDALEIAQKLRSEVTNTDHLTAVLNLHIQIYEKAGSLTQELCCLQQLISLHPLNLWYWKKLAETYLALARALPSLSAPHDPACKDRSCPGASQQLAGESASLKAPSDGASERSPRSVGGVKQPVGVSAEQLVEVENVPSSGSTIASNAELESRMGGDLRHLWLFACSSFVRARLLLHLTKPQQQSFILERSLAVQEEISQQLSSLRLSEELLDVLNKAMGKDLLSERIRNGAETEQCAANPSALAITGIESSLDFEEKWFMKPIPQAHITTPQGKRRALDVLLDPCLRDWK